VLGLGAAAAYANRLGAQTIEREARARTADLRERLAPFPRLRLLDHGSELAAMVTFTTEAIAPEALHRALLEENINTSLSWRNYATLDFVDKRVEWALRVSPHYYNSSEEIDLFAETLARILPH
jgi:selenocysteine lyase/cysteine desulfurase